MRTHVLDYNRDIINDKRTVAAIGVLFFVLATAFGAYVRIPVKGSPVPITLQTFFVILSGAVLGRKLGTLSQTAYFILGIAGLPIFQGSVSGAAYLAGPTAGYLIGFIASAYLIGKLIEIKPTSFAWSVLTFALGSLVIYVFGISWLIYMYKMNFVNAFSTGILPFIPGDIAKILFAGIIYSKISVYSKNRHTV
jgi:biotin transport system substrate-specific component